MAGEGKPELESLLVLLLSLIDVWLLAGSLPEGADEAHSQQGLACTRLHRQVCYSL